MVLRLFILCVAFLAGVTHSFSDIAYTSTNFILGDVWFPENIEYFDLDVDANGSIDFSLTAAGTLSFAGIHPENQNKYLIHPSPPPNIGGPVAALNLNYIIDSNSGSGTPEEWFGNNDYGGFILILSTGRTGEFYNDRGFVGLKFDADDGIHYGWIDVEGIQSSPTIQIRGWAYETEPNKAIAAGAIPEPSSISLLLLSGTIVWLSRNRKRKARIPYRFLR